MNRNKQERNEMKNHSHEQMRNRIHELLMILCNDGEPIYSVKFIVKSKKKKKKIGSEEPSNLRRKTSVGIDQKVALQLIFFVGVAGRSQSINVSNIFTNIVMYIYRSDPMYIYNAWAETVWGTFSAVKIRTNWSQIVNSQQCNQDNSN